MDAIRQIVEPSVQQDNMCENPFLVGKNIESDSPFSRVMNQLFSFVNGRVKNVADDKCEERKNGKLYAIGVIYEFLKSLTPKEFEGKTENEIARDLKERGNKLIIWLKWKKEIGFAFEESLKESLEALKSIETEGNSVEEIAVKIFKLFEQKKRTEPLSLEYKEGMATIIGFFDGRFSCVALLFK